MENTHTNKNMESESLNNSVPLETLYKSLLNQYKRQNRYIDKLEEEIADLKQRLENKKAKIRHLNEEMAGYKLLYGQGCKDYASMQRKVIECVREQKRIDTMTATFLKQHKKHTEVKIDAVRGLFKSFKDSNRQIGLVDNLKSIFCK